MKTFFRSLHSLRARLAVFCIASVLALGGRASAITYTVTTATDHPVIGNTIAAGSGVISGGTGNTLVTLRSAVIAANMSGAGPHTINVPAGLGIYNLSVNNPNTPATTATVTNPDLQVGSHGSTVTIIGTGGTPKIVQTNQTNVFYSTTGNDVITTGFKADLSPAIVNLTLNNLEITGGQLTGIFTGADDGTTRSSTTITNCNIHDNSNADAFVGQGGAIYNQSGSLTVTGTTFANNSASNATTGQGGAIFYNLPSASGQGSQGDLSITGCTFTSNTAAVGATFPAGGAIFVSVVSSGTAISITGNNFISNAATSGNGGAIALVNTTRATNINFNRFIGNTGANGTVLNNNTATSVNANTNWWSRNTGPAVGEIGGSPVAATSWLQLKLAASPTTINVGQTSALTASFLSDSANNAVPAANLTALVGQTVTWTGGALGTISSAQTTIQAAGTATATFTGTAGGAASPSAQVDNAPAATASITVNVPDTTPPDTTITGNPSNPTNSTTATFTFTGTDNVTPPGSLTFEAQIDNNGFVAVTSPHTYTGLPDGTRTFQVRARDAASNPDPTPATFIWTIDTTPPAAPVVVTPANGSTTNDTTPTVTGTAEANSTVTVFFDGAPNGTAPADGAGNWSYTPGTALATAPHTVKARAADALGNTSVDSNTNAFTVALTPSVTTPTVAFLTNLTASLGGNVTGDGGSAITARGVVYSVTTTNNNPQIGGPGVTVLNDPANTTGVFNVSATGLTQGTGYSFVAYATNANGTTYTTPVSTFTTLTPDYNVTTTGNAIVITDAAGNSDTLAVSEPGAGSIRFAAIGRSFSVDGGVTTFDSVAVSLGGVTAITVNAAVGADIINVGAFTGTLPSLTVNGGTGDDTVNLNGDITFAANANLDLDLQNDDAAPGTDIVNVATNANILISGTGTITVKVSRNITLASGASLVTVDGALTLNANVAGTTVGNFIGIALSGATVQATGAGAVTLTGHGGDGSSAQHGIYVADSSVLRGGTGANLAVTGTGGVTGGTFNNGVMVDTGGTITSSGANVTVTGQGGGTAVSTNNRGVQWVNTSTSAGLISAGGSGSVTIMGTGGLGTGTTSYGVRLFAAGLALSTAAGDVNITGIAGGSTSDGFSMGSSSAIQTGGTGKLVVNADRMTIGSTNSITASQVTLRQKTIGQPINVGAADSAAQLGLTDAELDRITAPTLNIGDANSGAITVSTAISRPAATNVTLNSGGTIAINTGAFDTAGGNLTVNPGGATNTFGPLAVGTDVNLGTGPTPGTLGFGSGDKLAVTITGITPDSGFTQLKVTGKVDLTGAALSLAGGYVPAATDTFTIIDNDGTADAVTGTFAGLAEGATLPFNGVTMVITYQGGDGNDVVLIANRPPVPGVVTVTRYPTQPVKIPVATIVGAATDPDVGDTISLFSVSNGANGTAQIVGAFVLYTPTGNFSLPHTFSYVIQDNHGTQATGSVTVNVIVDNAGGQNITKLVRLPDGTAVVSFAGIPGLTYGVQYKTLLSDPTWTNLGPVTVDAFGAATYTDNDPVHKAAATGFYRFIYPAPPAGP